MQLYSRGPLERLILTPLFCPACHTVDHVELLAHTIAHYTLYCASTPVAAAALGLVFDPHESDLFATLLAAITTMLVCRSWNGAVPHPKYGAWYVGPPLPSNQGFQPLFQLGCVLALAPFPVTLTLLSHVGAAYTACIQPREPGFHEIARELSRAASEDVAAAERARRDYRRASEREKKEAARAKKEKEGRATDSKHGHLDIVVLDHFSRFSHALHSCMTHTPA